MIKGKDLEWYTVEGEEMDLARLMGFRVIEKVGTRSHSNVYSDPNERARLTWRNQMTGQSAQLAGTKYVTGSIEAYKEHQDKAYEENTDHGIDIPPNIDIKSGLMKRKGGTNPFSQELIVGPREFKDNWIYFYCQVHKLTEERAEICMVGWARSADLEGKLSKRNNIPRGSLGIPAFKLRPIVALQRMWEVRNG